MDFINYVAVEDVWRGIARGAIFYCFSYKIFLSAAFYCWSQVEMLMLLYLGASDTSNILAHSKKYINHELEVELSYVHQISHIYHEWDGAEGIHLKPVDSKPDLAWASEVDSGRGRMNATEEDRNLWRFNDRDIVGLVSHHFEPIWRTCNMDLYHLFHKIFLRHLDICVLWRQAT